MKKRNFLVTGGNGFIGEAIVNLLIELNHNVTVLDNNFRLKTNRLKKFKKKLNIIKGDIRDKNVVLKSCKNINSVIHLAYINGTKYFYEKPKLVLDVGIRGMLNIIDSSIKNNVQEFYLASSSEVYGYPLKFPTPEDSCLKVENIKNPRFSYGGGKILSELIALHYSEKKFKKLIIFRPHNVYGPNMGNEHVIPELIRKIQKNKKIINIQGSGKDTRSFIFIDDFKQAFNCILKKGKNNEIYNIGTNQEIKIKTLVKNISKCIRKKIDITSSKKLDGSVQRRNPDINKLIKLGFKPTFNIEKGLEKTIDWYLKNN